MINIHPQYKKARNFHKSAFTMLELIMVIVVLGILASLALPRMERDLRQEAGDNILSAIRYTQHLALMDNKTDPDDSNWQQEYWQIRFSTGASFFYIIASNIGHADNIPKGATAIDPANGRYMHNVNADTTIGNDESPNIFIGKKYSINSLTHRGGCSRSQHIAFDHLGRPHTNIYNAGNDFASYMKRDCILTFGFEDTSITDLVIRISKETGYAQIVDQNAS